MAAPEAKLGSAERTRYRSRRMAAPDRPDLADLDLSPAQMQAMGEAVVARAVGHLAALRDQPSRGDLSDMAALCRTLPLYVVLGPDEQKLGESPFNTDVNAFVRFLREAQSRGNQVARAGR